MSLAVARFNAPLIVRYGMRGGAGRYSCALKNANGMGIGRERCAFTGEGQGQAHRCGSSHRPHGKAVGPFAACIRS